MIHLNNNNSFWLTLNYLIALGISLVTLKLNITLFGSEKFGIWILISSIWGFTSALDFGFGTAIVKYVALYSNMERDKLSPFLSTSMAFYVLFGLLTTLIGIVLGEFLYFTNNRIIFLSIHHEMQIVYLILALAFYLRFLSFFYKSIYEGFNNFVLTSKLAIVYNILILVGVIIVFESNGSMILLAFVYLFNAFFSLLFYYFSFKKKHSDVLIKVQIKFSILREIIPFSFSAQLISIFSALIDPVIKLVIGNYYNVGFISLYEIGRRFATAISGIYFNAFRTILPRVSILNTGEEEKKYLFTEGIRNIKLGIIYSGFSFGIMAFPLCFIIKSWFGFEETIIVFLILCLPEAVNNFGFTYYMFLIGVGKVFFIATIQFINIVIISVSLMIGFVVFKSELGLLGYFLTVLLVNFMMLLKIKAITNTDIYTLLKSSRILKLILLLTYLFAGLLIINLTTFSSFYVTLAISILSIILFYRDLFEYSALFSHLFIKT